MNDPHYSEVSLQELPPMRVVSYRAISATPEDDAAKVLAEWTAEQLLPPTLRSFGFDVEITAEQKGAGLRGYELWIAVPPGTKPEDDMLERQFMGGLYAVMLIYDALDDPFARIPAGWEYLHKWVTANPQYEPAEHQMLEEVIIAGDGGAQHRHLVIYYPVAPIAVGVPS